MSHATSAFQIDTFETGEALFEDGGVVTSRSTITKTFHGELEATSSVEMLGVLVDGDGAGYVAVETVRGTLEGRSGTFVLLHVGTMSEAQTWGKWPIVPGSGTEGLVGLSGEARIEIAPDGAHALHLDYELPSG